ncbi:FAD-dependent oxidoreductase [Bosea sp. TAF32]|uniref:FAD-dependent oxidoreductase n=1 Tax=Bosea sp. TAF32 TaxID=3237482 RepID=UPI003F8E8A72
MTADQGKVPEGLAALNRRVARELELLTLPAAPWVPQRDIAGEPLLDVAIIGAGMAGLAAAGALRNIGLRAVNFDRRPKGFEGPWATTARMETLRSPKTLTGPALGIPSLTFRAWFEAQFGAEDWERLDKIPRLMWMDYLRWFRDVLRLDVRNDHDIAAIHLGADYATLEIDAAGKRQRVRARHVVLATGRDGLGGPFVPAIADSLPRERWAHSSDANDYAALRGKRVAVVGAGASAMDSAGTALEAGAERVDLLIRRRDIPRINRGKGMGHPGSIAGYRYLPDDWKWRINSYIAREQVPPPRASVLRVSRYPNAFFRQGTALHSARMDGDEIVVETSAGTMRFDFIIFSTGFRVDWDNRPFLAEIAASARLWSDRGVPADADAGLGSLPDLGTAFEFQPKIPGACPGLERVHCFCYPAMMSHGTVSGDIPAISDGAVRLSQAVAARLFVEDVEAHFARGQEYSEPEIFGDEWEPILPEQAAVPV